MEGGKWLPGGGMIWGCSLGEDCRFGAAGASLRMELSVKWPGARKPPQNGACRVSAFEGFT